MADETTKEPGNWELYRGIERVEKALRDGFAGTVSVGVYTAEKTALNARIDDLGAEVSGLRSQQDIDRAGLAANQKAQEEQRGRNRLFVSGIIAGPLIGAFVVWLINGGLVR